MKKQALKDLKEPQAKEYILELVSEYCRQYHTQSEYRAGDRIPYAGRIYDADEIVNLVDSALEFWLTAGHWTDQFEKGLAEYLGVRFCCLVNSGSSANLAVFMALTSPLLGERAIKRGDEVITVACGFPTTVAPLVQFGAIPVFVDVTIPQYNIDVAQLELALSPKTKAVMLAHTLGNPFDIQAVRDFCDKHNLWMVEDNCDALGSEYKGKKTGTWGDIGTSSFYPPHHMTMGEGGAVYTNHSLLYKIIRSMRDWGRDCVCASGQDNRCGCRFNGRYGELPFGYDHKYVYSHFSFLSEALSGLENQFILPQANPESNPSWFGFLLTCREGIDRNAVVQYLETNGIQTRMLLQGIWFVIRALMLCVLLVRAIA